MAGTAALTGSAGTAGAQTPGARRASQRADPGRIWLYALILLTALIVVPPIWFLLKTSFTIEGADNAIGLDHYRSVFELGGTDLWRVSLIYAIGSSCFAIVIGVSSAWLVARTNAYFRQVTVLGAYLSLAAPVMVKSIGWILLLGPNKGVINEWLRGLFGIEGVPIELFSLGGMTLLEGLLWSPIVFLFTLPTLSAMDPSLEEACAMSGASLWQTFSKVTIPLALPGILAVFLLTFIRSLESFEIPFLVGTPANLQTFTTAIYQTIHRGLIPQYGEASAYAVMLVGAVALPLLVYYRITRHAQKYATITGKGFRPSRIDLGALRIPAGLYLLIMPLALVAPLLILFWASFLPIYEAPSLVDIGRMSLRNYYEVLTRPTTVDGVWNGVVVATLSSTAVTVFTFVLAWTAIRRREPSRWSLDLLASLPLVLPGIVLGTAILIEFLNAPFIPIYGTIWIMVFAFLVRFMPYGIRFCYAGIVSIHIHLEECAKTCGAGTFMMLRRIVLPLALPAVASIWVYVLLHSIRDLSLPIMLAGPENRLISVVILDLWNEGKVPEVGALSVLLAAAATLLGWMFMRMSRRYGAKVF